MTYNVTSLVAQMTYDVTSSVAQMTCNVTSSVAQMTWADLSVMNSWHWIPGFGVYPPMEKYPKLKAHKERIEALPRISDWLEKRPVTPV